MDRWVAGILMAFAVLVSVYILFIGAALQDPIELEPSYLETRR